MRLWPPMTLNPPSGPSLWLWGPGDAVTFQGPAKSCTAVKRKEWVGVGGSIEGGWITINQAHKGQGRGVHRNETMTHWQKCIMKYRRGAVNMACRGQWCNINATAQDQFWFIKESPSDALLPHLFLIFIKSSSHVFQSGFPPLIRTLSLSILRTKIVSFFFLNHNL